MMTDTYLIAYLENHMWAVWSARRALLSVSWAITRSKGRVVAHRRLMMQATLSPGPVGQ